MVRRIEKNKENFIKFLGTAGARFVMIKQLRASGGIWLSFKGTNILIDPGPGSLVRCAASKPRLDPSKLDAIILTHRHLDHSNDINVMIEAMTEGGFKKRGLVFLPSDAVNKDPIILSHVHRFPKEIVELGEGKSYSVGEIKFSAPKRNPHSVETYGIKFFLGKITVSFVSDTDYFEGIEDYYKADIVIINVVFFDTRDNIEHLSLAEAKEVIQKIKPKLAILTHFGMTMIRNNPYKLALKLKDELDIDVVAAYDGMKLDLSKF